MPHIARRLTTSLRIVACVFATARIAFAGTKTEHFDADPQWDSLQNRVTLQQYPTVTQDFGYARGTVAAKTPGEIGGTVCRSATPAWYAMKLETPRTLAQPLQVSGSFTIPRAGGGTVFFGFFNSEMVLPGGRPPSSLGLHLNGARDAANVHLRFNSPDNQGCGTNLATGPQTTGTRMPSIPAGDVRHTFWFSYDPAGANGRGVLRGQIDDLPEGVAELPEGYKDKPFSFDRFGIMNGLRQGPRMTLYFADLKIDDKPIDLSHDPGWDTHGNHDTYETHEVAGVQDYGFIADTNRAGGKSGEIGGTIWRTERPNFYGDRVGTLSLDDRIEASGRISMTVGAPDSGLIVGFFNADDLRAGRWQNILGVQLEGPTRVGHYLRPMLIASNGKKRESETGPVLAPEGKPHTWKFTYTARADGDGMMTMTLDGKTIEQPVPRELRAAGARLDHFGLFPAHAGGGAIKMTLDDLTYTSAPSN
jgi:hypothetical protein